MLTRRGLLSGAAAALTLGCSRSEKATPPPITTGERGVTAPPRAQPSAAAPSGSTKLLEWDFDGAKAGMTRAAVLVPTWGDATTKYPVLIALHGRGEAMRGPSRGALGWPNDYKLTRAFDRLRAPPLTEQDYEGFVEPARMDALNASLKGRPFGGLVVACPHVPDVMSGEGPTPEQIARFLLEDLLPRVRKETPAQDAPEATGIDGVSMGGILALKVGLASPGAFGAVGSLQAAVSDGEVAELTELARSARAKRPALKLRLLTSHDDYFRLPIRHLSDSWRAAGIDHDFADVIGPHDYPFNRGPGSIEMLSWHDRALRG